jgi:hypothetical protein
VEKELKFYLQSCPNNNLLTEPVHPLDASFMGIAITKEYEKDTKGGLKRSRTEREARPLDFFRSERSQTNVS